MDLRKLLESLSPNESKILPFLEEDLVSICKKSNLDKTSVTRALEYLQNKGIVELVYDKKKIADLGVNGIFYRKKGLPERKLLDLLKEKRIIQLEDAEMQSKLSNDEFKVSLGILKRKSFIDINNKKIILNVGDEEVSKKMPEEIFIEKMPIDFSSLSQQQMQIFRELQKRRELVKIREEKDVKIKITAKGKELVNSKIKTEHMIEQITPEIIKNERLWKGKRFRRYDILSKVPEISGGKRHFVNQAVDYTRKIWTDMGFEEITGNIIESSFWNFDALFTPQDHPAREMQDTFFINKKMELPERKVVENVKQVHEQGVGGSKGWKYDWDAEEAKKLVLRTHTTVLSAKKLYELSKLPINERKGKFFAIGKNFRNETVDWSHGFEFYQTEGIVVDDNVTFRHLLGYLKQFYEKMGFKKIKFVPSYFAYTEPSVEVYVWHSEKKIWFELGGAGIFRPEISIPLLGKETPILAWGQGLDRIIMDYYKIKDLRELYKNDISQLRKIKFWIKK